MENEPIILGWRRWSLSVLGLSAYVLILLLQPQIDPLSLGLGIGFILFPHAVSKFGETYINKKIQERDPSIYKDRIDRQR